MKFLFLKVQGNKLYGFELRLHENQLVLESIKYNTQKDQVALYMRFLASVQISLWQSKWREKGIMGLEIFKGSKVERGRELVPFF